MKYFLIYENFNLVETHQKELESIKNEIGLKLKQSESESDYDSFSDDELVRMAEQVERQDQLKRKIHFKQNDLHNQENEENLFFSMLAFCDNKFYLFIF